MTNLFSQIPSDLPKELMENLVVSNSIRIERILSQGHSSPKQGWYDQKENEWVTVLKGHGTIEFESGRICTLTEGDCMEIKAHEKHKVLSTAPDKVTVWLAVFYPASPA